MLLCCLMSPSSSSSIRSSCNHYCDYSAALIRDLCVSNPLPTVVLPSQDDYGVSHIIMLHSVSR